MSTPFSPINAEADAHAEIVFFQALKKSPDNREAFLNGECGADRTLRAEVEGMLRDHESAGSFLSVDAPAAAELDTKFSSLTPEEAGERIGHYKLLQQIGEGGCGVVWMAEQEEPVRRRVAVKVIKLGMDTKQVIARFEAERQALALMDHPNIARVLDAGATDTGRPYFVMELVRGIRITTYCDQNNLTTEARLGLFTQVCQAVQHAHQKGIIHRDIKPSNILVTLHDGVPVPKVIDFGIAKATTGQQLTDKTIFTAFEQFIGTPAYMSPEQAEMSGLDIDTRSDIYALGVLLYELLTGQTPFDAKELLASGLDAMRRTIREQEPPRPSTRLTQEIVADDVRRLTISSDGQPPTEEESRASSRRLLRIRELAHSLRGDLDWIVMKALEKDRTRRYESASSLAKDIQRHLNDEPVTARPPGNLYRFRKLVRRNKGAFAAASAVLAALIIGLGVSTWMFFKEKHARERAVTAERDQSRLRQLAETQERKATTEAAKSRQVAGFLEEMLKGVGPSVALGRDTKMLREILDKTAARVAMDLNDQPEVEADLRSTLGQVYVELGDYKEAKTMYDEVLAIRKKLFGDEHPAVADALYQVANTTGVGDGETLHREALAMRRKLLGEEHPDVARSLNALAMSIRLQGRFADAETMASDALAMMRKLLGNDHPEVTNVLFTLAQSVGHQKRYVESGAFHSEALEILRKEYGNKHPLVARTLLNLSQNMRSQDRLEEAEALNREALEMHRELLGDKHPESMGSLNELADVLREAGKLDEVEALYREYLAMQRTLLGNESGMVSHSLQGLAHLLEERGKYPEAESMFREGLDLYDRLLEIGDLTGMDTLKWIARALKRNGRLSEAEPLFRERLARRREMLGKEHEIVGLTLHHYAVLLYHLNRREEAAVLRSEAMDILRKTCADDPRMFEDVLKIWAEFLYRRRIFAEAEPLYRSVISTRQEGGVATRNGAITSTASLGRLLADWAWTERHQDAGTSPGPTGDGTGDGRPEPATPRERAAEAERMMRHCISEWADIKTTSQSWRMSDYRSRLGGALVAVVVTDPDLSAKARLAKLTEAESLLNKGYEGLQPSNRVGTKYCRDALLRLVRLYKAWDKPDLAAEWQEKLDEFVRKHPSDVYVEGDDHGDE